MQFDFITIFPDIVHQYANESIIGRAQSKKLLTVVAHNLRDFTSDKWGHVDDRPYGGGAGMILQIDPLVQCLKSIGAIKTKLLKNKTLQVTKTSKKTRIILLSPAGKTFTQKTAEKYRGSFDQLIFICGRYEGVDARVAKIIDESLSIGDFVLAGGELAGLVVTEAVARLIPGVLGNSESLKEETTKESKEYPQYTRPENYHGWKVPKVLLDGNHGAIATWRKKRQK